MASGLILEEEGRQREKHTKQVQRRKYGAVCTVLLQSETRETENEMVDLSLSLSPFFSLQFCCFSFPFSN